MFRQNNFKGHSKPSYPVGFNGLLEGLTELSRAVIPTTVVYYSKRKQVKISNGKSI